MKKSYLLFLLSIFSSLFVVAQIGYPIQNNIKSLSVPNPVHLKSVNNKTATCIDSIRYPQSKLTGIAEISSLTNNITQQTGISQAYHFVGNGTIYGIGIYALLDFDGVPNNTTPIQAKIKIYNIDGQNYPTTLIDSAMVQVVDVGFKEQTLMFSSPITVTDSFAVALEMGTFNATTDTIYYTTNVCGWNGSTCVTADGNGENLSCILSPAYISANGSHWFNDNLELLWDIDMLMYPIFEQTTISSYVSDLDSVCLGSPVKFTNTSTAYYNRMFNIQSTRFLFNLGDASTYNLDTNYRYTYAAAGIYNTNLVVTSYGYSRNCTDSSALNITVLDTSKAKFGFTDMGGGTFQFLDSSANANTYAWNFGDGVGTSNIANPSYTYSSVGNYNVCLTVTNTNSCNTNTFCDSTTFTVGISENNNTQKVNIYPIPAKKYFNIDVPNNYIGGKIILSDIVGKELKTVIIGNNTHLKIPTSDILNGIYFVSIEVNTEKIYTKRIIINH